MGKTHLTIKDVKFKRKFARYNPPQPGDFTSFPGGDFFTIRK
jgi:hypothetical protein